MILETFCLGLCQTNCYVVGSEKTHIAFIVDAPQGAVDPVLEALEKYQLTPHALLLTHSHWDHIADAKKLSNRLNIPIWIHKEDAPNLLSPGKDKLPVPFTIEGATPSVYLEENTPYQIGDFSFEVLHTPGHTPGGVCFYFSKENILFSGDTLFQGTMGRIDFPYSNPDQMWQSLHKLSTLPPNLRVFPGHGDPTTIGRESWMSKAKQLFNY